MNPANLQVITAAGIDCCILANNHVLDWGCPGLVERYPPSIKLRCIMPARGLDSTLAAAPAILEVPDKARVLVFAFATPSAGVPCHWAATPDAPGINVLRELSRKVADRIGKKIFAQSGDGTTSYLLRYIGAATGATKSRKDSQPSPIG